MIVRDVAGKFGVFAAGDYHPHAFRRVSGQERSNAGKSAARPGTLILIKSVHDQHKTFAAFSGPLASQVKQPEALPIPSSRTASARYILASIGGELFHHGLGKCAAIRLAGKTASNEE